MKINFGLCLFNLLFPYWLFKSIFYWKKDSLFMVEQYKYMFENMFKQNQLKRRF